MMPVITPRSGCFFGAAGAVVVAAGVSAARIPGAASSVVSATQITRKYVGFMQADWGIAAGGATLKISVALRLALGSAAAKIRAFVAP